MTDEAVEEFKEITKEVNPQVELPEKYSWWRLILFTAIGATIGTCIGAGINNAINKDTDTGPMAWPMSRVCLITCGQGQVAKFSDTECECREGKG